MEGNSLSISHRRDEGIIAVVSRCSEMHADTHSFVDFKRPKLSPMECTTTSLSSFTLIAILPQETDCSSETGDPPIRSALPILHRFARLPELRLDLGVSPIETTQISFNFESSIPIFCQVV